MASLKRQLAEGDRDRRSLEQKVLQLRDEVESSLQAKEETLRDASRLQASVDLLARWESWAEQQWRVLAAS